MAALTVQNLSRTAITPAYSAAANGGDTFVNNGRTWIHAKNAGASAITATVAIGITVDGQSVNGLTFLVAGGGGDRKIGPFPGDIYNSGGSVSLTYTTASGLTLGAFSLP